MNKGTKSFSLDIVVPNRDPDAVFQSFLTDVWILGGYLPSFLAPKIITAGDAKTCKGNVRKMPLGIQEEIVHSKQGDSLEYRIVGGPFPVDYHHARVEFLQLVGGQSRSGSPSRGPKENGTLVIWKVCYTPSHSWLAALLYVVMFVNFKLCMNCLLR